MKVAILIPCHRNTEALFTLSLAGLIAKSVKELPHELRTFLAQGTILDNRNGLAEAALEWGADWLLWLDADQTFPDDALIRLLGHNLDVVGCNYPRRRPNDAPTAVKAGEPLYTDRPGPVEEADSIGLGVALTKATVFDAIERPWFTFVPKGSGHVSEDVTFCRALWRAAVPVHVDHALSWEVGHISEQVLTNQDTRRRYVSTVLASAGAK